MGDVSRTNKSVQSEVERGDQTTIDATEVTQAGPSPTSVPEAQPTSRWKRSMFYRVWAQGKGMLMVVLSQFFGSSMNVMTQLLERDGSHGKAMHPFQVRKEHRCIRD